MNGLFDYFQVSVLISFCCLFVARTLYLRWSKKITAISLTIGDKGIQGILTLSLFVAISAWVATILVYVLHPNISFLPSPLDAKLIDSVAGKIAGVTLIVFSLAIYVLAVITLGASWRVGNSEQKTGELVTHGIYAISRNPIYVSFILYFVGTFLINGALIFLIFTILVVLNMHYLILEEERSLSKTYGSAFREYCTATKRYMTWRKIRPVK